MKRHLFALLAVMFTVAGPAGAQQSRPVQQDEPEYSVMLWSGKKVGWMLSQRSQAGGKVTSSTEVTVTMGRGGVPISLSVKETTVETADGQPLSFTGILSGVGMEQKVEGTISDGKMKLLATSGGATQMETKPWPEGALMAEGAAIVQRKQGLKSGTKYQIRLFEPLLANATDAEIVIGPTKDIDLLGRVVQATEVVTKIEGLTGEKGITSYVDENFHLLKSSMTVMGMKMDVVSASKAAAMSKPEVFDAFDALLADSPNALENFKAAPSATYEFQPKTATKLTLLESDYQQVKAGAGGAVVVTVVNRRPAEDYELPYKGQDKPALAALKPARYVQSDNAKVMELARQAVGDEKSAAKAAQKLEAFVAGYIKKKNLSIGYASAVEVAKSRQGDCTEHAVLLAAMCRAAGIPAQVVCGLVYVPELGSRKDVFGGHAWVQAYIGEQWVPLDAALKGFDVGHIAICAGDGNPEGFFGIANTFGNFTITKAGVGR